MKDQADGLRELVRARTASAGADAPSRGRSLLLTSGKGGVGTSNLALNLAVALGDLGRKVVLVDADLGLANIDLLCGLAPAVDLGDVLAGEAALSEATVEGPAGIKVVTGAHAMRTPPELLDDAAARLADELPGLAVGVDFVIVDGGSGLGPGPAALAAAVDEVVVVTTPEPVSMADAHAAIGRLWRRAGARLRVLVNQANSASEGAEVADRIAGASRQFLGAVVAPLGVVRADPHVPLAVRARRPFLAAYPKAPASRGVRRAAAALVDELQPPSIAGARGPGLRSWRRPLGRVLTILSSVPLKPAATVVR